MERRKQETFNVFFVVPRRPTAKDVYHNLRPQSTWCGKGFKNQPRHDEGMLVFTDSIIFFYSFFFSFFFIIVVHEDLLVVNPLSYAQ